MVKSMIFESGLQMNGKELIKRLRKEGWALDRIKGSHHIYKKDGMLVAIPVHGHEDLPAGTLKNIIKHTGLKLNP